MIRMTEDQYNAMVSDQDGGAKPKRRHKYNAQPTEYNGRKYPSKAHARRAAELDTLQAAGIVAWWFPEVPIPVHDPEVDRPFRVDFLVGEHADGHRDEVVVRAEDVKGADTPKFRQRIRQWKKRGPFPLWIIRSTGIEVIRREDMP